MQHQAFPAHGKAYTRSIRATTTAILSIGLLVGTAVGVAAQDARTQLPELLPQLPEIFDSMNSDPANVAVDPAGTTTDLALETPTTSRG